MLFGSFMLFFYFNRMLERETEQGKRENLLFQTIYDMVYQNMENTEQNSRGYRREIPQQNG